MSSRILVTGASGYVGTRLIGSLLAEGYQVRAVARSLDSLKKRAWSTNPHLEMMTMDAFDPRSVQEACSGCEAVYYFIHSMNSRIKDFAASDRKAAENMVFAAAAEGLKRIIYLGGLGDKSQNLSHHLQSRAEVSMILHSGKTPVTTFRAAMVMGNASVSFEILAYLVQRLPIMITPKWVRTESQPIAIRNVVYYLTKCLKVADTAGQIYDIGGPEIINYETLMRMYALEAGYKRRWIVPVPLLTPWLSSHWIQLVTPIDAALARPLAEGLKNRVVCEDFRIRNLMPQDLFDCRTAIQLALGRQHQDGVVLPGGLLLPPVEAVWPGDPAWAGGGRKH